MKVINSILQVLMKFST